MSLPHLQRTTLLVHKNLYQNEYHTMESRSKSNIYGSRQRQFDCLCIVYAVYLMLLCYETVVCPLFIIFVLVFQERATGDAIAAAATAIV